MLTDAQRHRWTQDGFLHLPGYFGDQRVQIASWTEAVQAWPETPGKWMKYFESPKVGDRQLCRIEHFLEHHTGWRDLITEPRLLSLLDDLFGESSVLFKEKINFKLPGGLGFTPHQDAPAFATFGQDYHITAMISIDATHLDNGCLELARGYHREGLYEMAPDKSLSEAVIARLPWEPLLTEPGDLVLFGSYLPHGSGNNRTDAPRRAAYITYNPASQGDRRADYYRHKREVFPPECERVPGRDYADSGLYNIGNPIRR